MKQQQKGFTLVELIVVITILAILGTIAFISLQGFSKDARNSSRHSDIKSIEKVLSLYQLRENKFPLPTNPVNITYSGGTVWTQGTFGEDSRKQLGSQGQISNVPTDPLTTSEYTYSVLNTGNEYQLAGVFEGDYFSSNNLLNETYAAGVYGTTYVSGNYNGQVAKTSTGGTTYILAVPSIISGDITLTKVEEIVSNKLLAYNGSNILPSSYTGTTTVFEETLPTGDIVVPGNVEVYSTTDPSTDFNDEAEQQIIIDNLQAAYIGTVVADEDNIATIIESDGQSNELYVAQTLISNNIDGDVEIIASNNSGPVVTTYPGCDTPDITVGGITIAACNVGSTTIGTAYDDSASYGDYIQFGKSDNSWVNGSSLYSYDWKSPGGTNSGSANDWGVIDADRTTITYNTSTPENQIKMQGPCAVHYHVPTNKEWVDLIAASGVTNIATAYSELKLPTAGSRFRDGGNLINQGTHGNYWSASPNGSYAYLFYYYSGSFYPSYDIRRTMGQSVRCFKN